MPNSIQFPLLLLLSLVPVILCQESIVPAVRVVRLQIDYENADISSVQKINKWNSIMRNSVMASLRFINKHWLICGEEEDEKSPTDCGKAQVTGDIVNDHHYQINVTFISGRDPVKNAKVEATSTVFAVSQIGLKGGIFQYTNALKVLGKPSGTLKFDEAFFCYRGQSLVEGDKCRKLFVGRRLRDSEWPTNDMDEERTRNVEHNPIRLGTLIAL